MAKMTEKENYLRTIKGEVPAWVPRYGLGLPMYYPDGTPAVSVTMVGPSFLNAGREFGFGAGFDIFGVEYTATKDSGGMSLPTPNKFILDDITKWRDVIKVPDISDIDREMMAKRDYEMFNIDRENIAVELMTHVGYFMNLTNFMGFTNGLIAMFEEPDEVMALFDYMCGFYVEVTKKCLEYYKPDFVELTDDTATARNPFISADMYRKLVKPFHVAQTHPAVDAGLPVMMHNCGRCEDFIEDWFECGVTAWNPAQVMNDLDGIKRKYGNKLGLCGCWDTSGPVGWPDATEEMVRQAVRDTIDRFAPGGGFCFWGSTYGPIGDKATEDRKRWLTEEYDSYGRSFYERQAGSL